jgi:ubiquinone/menaquinone biosynthesis C-methylase UbiE
LVFWFYSQARWVNTLYLKPSIQTWLLQPLFRRWIGADRWDWFQQVDWHQATAAIQQANVSYPEYHLSQDFHGIRGGYLTEIAAITYDPVTRLASPPHEGWLRRQLLPLIQGQPQQILDLGCGTGSTTLLLKQHFPTARVTGLDLSPYMLVMADFKAKQTGREIRWHHGLAEKTTWDDATFDLVTISFLFHEMPPAISHKVLAESWRLLKPGGQLLILDGSQPALRRLGWLIDLFREPYSRVYAAGCLADWLTTAGFVAVASRPVGFIHQITTGRRPHP